MTKKITFITTGQPTTNPRLVKEAETLHGLGYEVKVIYCFYQRWAQKFDEEIIGKNPGMYVFCGGDPEKNRSRYYLTRLRQKLSTLLFKYTKSLGAAENAISRTHAEALAVAKKTKSDLYIAHNLGALPAAVLAAQHHQAKAGYDAEDLHSGQFTSDKEPLYLLNKLIEERYFSKADYFTAASPLIAHHYKKLYPYLEPVVINNVFPKIVQQIKPVHASPLKLFWFSQTIGMERGIEDIINAMPQVKRPVELHLLGSCSKDFEITLTNLVNKNGLQSDQVKLHEPISAVKLLTFATQFDIGMATETGVPLNRDICLTNKIFTYLQCGLALIASDTQAQVQFIDQYPATGMLYKKSNVQSLVNCINAYAENRELLDQTRLANYRLGQSELNWEQESLKFTAIVNSTLQNA